MPTMVRLISTTLLLLTPTISSAQIGGSGSIQGTVVDTSNAAIPGATVTATNVATGIATVRPTTEAGVYALMPLAPGQYRVTISLDGFRTFVRDEIIVDALSVVGLNVTLEVGGITQEVVVTAASPPLAPYRTTTKPIPTLIRVAPPRDDHTLAFWVRTCPQPIRPLTASVVRILWGALILPV